MHVERSFATQPACIRGRGVPTRIVGRWSSTSKRLHNERLNGALLETEHTERDREREAKREEIKNKRKREK